jgi:hypothetical protein
MRNPLSADPNAIGCSTPGTDASELQADASNRTTSGRETHFRRAGFADILGELITFPLYFALEAGPARVYSLRAYDQQASA